MLKINPHPTVSFDLCSQADCPLRSIVDVCRGQIRFLCGLFVHCPRFRELPEHMIFFFLRTPTG
jgi:hypothetical protein